MTNSIYKIWIITGMFLLAAGIPFFYPDLKRIAAFLAGAGIMFINVLLLGKALTALFGRTQAEAEPEPGHESVISPDYEGKPPAKGTQPVFLFLLILKYAFLLTTLYIAIVIIKLHPVPFVVGITILPVSIMMMGIFLMLRRHDNA